MQVKLCFFLKILNTWKTSKQKIALYWSDCGAQVYLKKLRVGAGFHFNQAACKSTEILDQVIKQVESDEVGAWLGKKPNTGSLHIRLCTVEQIYILYIRFKWIKQWIMCFFFFFLNLLQTFTPKAVSVWCSCHFIKLHWSLDFHDVSLLSTKIKTSLWLKPCRQPEGHSFQL